MTENILWTSVLSEIERALPNIKTLEESQILINQFEEIDEKYRDEKFPNLYLSLWKLAKKLGKIGVANNYAKKSLDYLIKFKRIPQIKSLLIQLNNEGMLKKKLKIYQQQLNILEGIKIIITDENLKEFDLFIEHPDHWKYSSEFLLSFLLLDENWPTENWKYAYEYILKNKFNGQLFSLLYEKAAEKKKNNFEKMFLAVLKAKNIKINSTKKIENKSDFTKKENLVFNYDQVAMDLISGATEPSSEEQRRVINSLKFISEAELLNKGQEMIVAFELLGMEEVVLILCEKVLSVLTDIKQRASTYFIWAQAYCNCGKFYKAIDLIDQALKTEPLNQDEQLAFNYVKAEACLKLKKIKAAKEIFMEIKKINPHYRLVSERLKEIGTT